MTYRRYWQYAPLAIAVALAVVACAFPHLAAAATTTPTPTGSAGSSAAGSTTAPNLVGAVATPFNGLLDQLMQLGGWAVAGTGVAALGGGLLGQQQDPKHSEIYHKVLNYAGGATLGGLLVAVAGPQLVQWIQAATGGSGALLR